MGSWIVTGQDGKRYRVTGDTAEGTVAAVKKMAAPVQSGADAMRARGLTSDPSGANAIAGADIQQAQDQAALDANPGLSRLVEFNKGVPLIGSYSDELAGVVGGDRAKEYTRGLQGAMEREHPGQSAGLQVAGGITGTIPALAAAPAMSGGMLAKMGIGAATGTAAGGIYGYGLGTDEEGNRGSEAGINAAIGGGIGAAAPPLLSAASAAARPVVDVAASALGIGNSRRAGRAVATAVERSGKTQDQIKAELAQALAEGQPEYRLADALGHPGQRMLSGIARRPGDARTEIVNMLSQRQEGQADRLGSFLNDSFGLTGEGRSAATAADAIKAARGDVADVAYGAARKNAGPVDVRGALAAIDERLGPMAEGKGVTGGPIDAKLVQFRQRLAGDGTELSDFSRVLDVKKDIGDAAEEAARAGRGNEARLLKRVAKELDGALEGSSPDYRAANDQFARTSRVLNAVDEGSEMARPSTRATDNVDRFGQMTPDERVAARVGYGDRQAARLESAAGPGTNRARPFTSEKSATERNAMALDPERLDRRIGRENTMFETYRQTLGGSQTADNLADSAESQGFDANALVNILSGRVVTGVSQIATALKQAAKGQNEETRQIIARALISREPGRVLAEATKQTTSDETRRSLVRALATAAGQNTGYFINQNP